MEDNKSSNIHLKDKDKTLFSKKISCLTNFNTHHISNNNSSANSSVNIDLKDIHLIYHHKGSSILDTFMRIAENLRTHKMAHVQNK